MRLRLLLTLGLVVFMATIASSNECYRYRHAADSKAEGEATGRERSATTEKTSATGEYPTLLVNKLLYI
jgi:hypothetical protein